MMSIQPKELSLFFELLGQATYYVQHVENSLHHLLAVMQFPGIGSVTADQANVVLEKYRRKTLGGLVSEIEKTAGLELPTGRLRALNDDRRWMIHQILKHEEYRLTTDATYRAQIFERLDRFVGEAQQLNKQIGDEMVRVTIAKGVSAAAFEQALQREFGKMVR